MCEEFDMEAARKLAYELIGDIDAQMTESATEAHTAMERAGEDRDGKRRIWSRHLRSIAPLRKEREAIVARLVELQSLEPPAPIFIERN